MDSGNRKKESSTTAKTALDLGIAGLALGLVNGGCGNNRGGLLRCWRFTESKVNFGSSADKGWYRSRSLQILHDT